MPAISINVGIKYACNNSFFIGRLPKQSSSSETSDCQVTRLFGKMNIHSVNPERITPNVNDKHS